MLEVADGVIANVTAVACQSTLAELVSVAVCIERTCNTLPPPAGVSKAGGEPAPVEVSTCPSEPVAIATGFPLAS